MRPTYKLTICLLAILLSGCGPKDKADTWDLVTTAAGVVYRINKQTGEVSLVTGAQITPLDEIRDQKKESRQKSYLKKWPTTDIKHLGDISLQLRTTWRDGKLHYILTSDSYSPQLQKERESPISKAAFILNFLDIDGFEVFSINVPIKEMTGIVDDTGKPSSLQGNGVISCGVDIYEAIGNATIGWGGFEKEKK